MINGVVYGTVCAPREIWVVQKPLHRFADMSGESGCLQLGNVTHQLQATVETKVGKLSTCKNTYDSAPPMTHTANHTTL